MNERKVNIKKINNENIEEFKKAIEKGYKEERDFTTISRVMTDKFNCPNCYHIPIEAKNTRDNNDELVSTGKGVCHRCHSYFEIPKLTLYEIEKILDRRWELYYEGKLWISD